MSKPFASIPGPRGHFLTGNLPEVRGDRLNYVLGLMHNYGDIVRLKFGTENAVLVFHPECVQHVLQHNHAGYSKATRVFGVLRPILGNGLLLSDGDFWLRQRRLMQPAFHRQQIEAMGEMMVGEAQSMLEGWSGQRDDAQIVDVQREMMRLTLSIVTQALFGRKVSDPDGTIARTVTFLLEDAIYRFDHIFSFPLWVPTPRNRHFRESRQELDQLVYELIAARRGRETEFDDLLSLLMQAQDADDQHRMSDEQLRDEVITLFLAGHETTAVALSWTLYMLSQHPAVEARLEQEVDAILGDRPPSITDLKSLVYARQVIEETMRLYPPAWITERMAIREDEIGGYRIPAGTTVAVSQYATHRHLQFWTDPLAFNPDRFGLDRIGLEHAANRPRFAYFPFGGGPRQCIGNTFAMVEAQLILAAIVQRFRLQLATGWSVEPEPLITLRPKNGLWMQVNRK